ncbi:helix-turn-helix domain-containing protein [Micromonospora polyrhachis]|uniref:DNA-binding transcriptional ArsR family regulator n=1 Tax=Micromonospora polyrhachis TaxID=1282883 RepID=A0A7W7SNR3_9ACTN|nr:winged helix-turn-helix domain-containing protein [Micromonospora polyrhachis]MBB4958169.1 DNA-binding transcriptional ArsR family regulator [Micromonospora polyrhachis]
MSREEVRPSATSLRGLAHPLRVRMLNLLREHGPATATLLAQRLSQSTGATSYHLRQLAQYGFVVEDPDRGAGRERWWKAAHGGTLLDGTIGEQAAAEMETYLRAVASLYAERVDRWLGERPTLPEEWRQASTLSDWRLRLTAAEAAALHDEIFALVQRYRRDLPETAAPVGAEQVVLQAQLLPFPSTDTE